MPVVVTAGAGKTRARHEVPVLTSLGRSSSGQNCNLVTRKRVCQQLFPIYALVGPGPSSPSNRVFFLASPT
jgi:hypothetical protein